MIVEGKLAKNASDISVCLSENKSEKTRYNNVNAKFNSKQEILHLKYIYNSGIINII